MLRAPLLSLLSMTTQYQGEMSHAVSSVRVSVHARCVCFPLLPDRAGMRASGGWASTREKAATDWKPKAVRKLNATAYVTQWKKLWGVSCVSY